MQRPLLQRVFSFGLAAAVTLSVLGGIGHLAGPDAAAPLFAQISSSKG